MIKKILVLFRFFFIIRSIAIYKVYELFPKNKYCIFFRIIEKIFFWMSHKNREFSLEKRLRFFLQTLGPIWIKFGQMLSTRKDLLPTKMISQLALLRNQVNPFDINLVRMQIESSLGAPLENFFNDFQIKPIASASIAQVHVANLKNGSEVAVKVIRPDIFPIVDTDIKLMYKLAKWIIYCFPDGRRLRPLEVVKEYERILLNELDLRRESVNSIQIREKFIDGDLLYIPKVYLDFCNKNVMVMERIYGIPIDDIQMIKNHGIDTKILAKKGIEIFFTQVLRDSIFHGDMHPGNIFVSFKNPENPKYIGIDHGIVGSLNMEDKRYIARNLIAFFNRDYRQLAKLQIDSGWVDQDVCVEKFSSTIRMVFEPIFKKPFSEISLGHLLLNLFQTGRCFDMKIQPQLILFQKTLLYIEGIGKQLCPELDLWKTAKPFLENWMKEQVNIRNIFNKIREIAPYLLDNIFDLPEYIFQKKKNYQVLKRNIESLALEIKEQKKNRKSVSFLIIFCIVYSTIDFIFFLLEK